MRNKIITILLISICAAIEMKSQEKYEIVFDKLTNNSEYYILRDNGQRKKIKSIQITDLDHIDVIVKNANPFVYKTQIVFKAKTSQNKTESENSGSLELLQSVLGQNPIGMLPQFFHGRDANSSSAFMKSIKDSENSIENLSTLINNSYDNNMLLYQEMVRTEEPIEKVQDTCLKFISKLKDNIKNIEETKKAVFGELYEANFLEPKNEQEALLKNNLNINFEQVLKLANHTLTYPQLIAIEKSVEKMSTPLKKSYVFENINQGENEGYESDNYEEQNSNNSLSITNLQIEISFIKIDDQIRELGKAEINNEDFVTYYFPNVWIDSEGIVQNQACTGCKPQIQATGFINKNCLDIMKPFNISELSFDGSCEYGLWTIYSETGEITNKIMLSENRVKSSDVSSPDKIEDVQYILIEQKTSSKPSWSTGVFFISPFEGRNDFEKIYSYTNDSVMISNNNQKQFIPTLGSAVTFDLIGSKKTQLTGSLGGSINLFSFTQDNEGTNMLNFFGGLGIKNKTWDYLSFSMGFSYSQSSVLKNNLEVNKWYSYGSHSYEKSVNDSYTKKVFLPGLYFGLHFNL